MASVHPHGKGFRVHYVREGRKQKSESMPTRDAALAWIDQHLPAELDGRLFNLVDLWRKENPTPYREDAAHRLSRLVNQRGWLAPERLTANDLATWVREDPGWRRPCQYLRTVLRWAAAVHRIPVRSDVLSWRPPRQSRKAKPPLLTDEQVQLILARAAELGPRSFAVIDYLSTYGARPITAVRLRVSGFDADHGELVLGENSPEKKSGGWRHRLYVKHLDQWPTLWWEGDAAAVPIFPHYKEDRAWRITRGRADELASFYANRISAPLAGKLGTLTGIYDLKRYAITRLFRAGVDPGTIALFTGHMDEKQLMTYATSNSDLQDGALMKLAAMSGSQKGSQVPKNIT